MRGWLVNDSLGMIPGAHTFWHDLLEWFPEIEDKTGGYTPYDVLVQRICSLPGPPDFIIRNASFFPPIPLRVPQIAFLQDVLFGNMRQLQIEVCRRAAVTVVNSTYTAAQYPELHAQAIPIGVEFDHFRIFPTAERDAARQKWGIPAGAICFIGSGDSIKGFAQVERLIRETDLTFCLVMKDNTVVDIPGRVRTLTRVSHDELVEVINACAVGLCASVRETQHLAGLEMGACGLPLVTSDVGIYYQRPDGDWGMRAEPDEYAWFLQTLRRRHASRDLVRSYWINEGFTRETCRARWRFLIEEVTCQSLSPAG